MKEEMVKQQAMFNRKRERSEHDRENTAHEREEMKCLNDQPLAQIIALRTPENRLHHQRGPLMQRLQVAIVSKLKASQSSLPRSIGAI